MLETPKAPSATVAKISADGTMDNQQVTAIIAGLYMGEGNFSLYRSNKDKPQITVTIGFANQDPALVDFVCSWLCDNGIAHFVCQTTKSYQTRVNRMSHVIRFLDLVQPFLMGNKLAEARILRRFCEKRLTVSKYGTNAMRRYDNEDEAMLEEKAMLKGTPETTRFPRCFQAHRHATTPDRNPVTGRYSPGPR